MTNPILGTIDGQAWQHQAACSDDPDRMHPDRQDKPANDRALLLCRGGWDREAGVARPECPIREQCLQAHKGEVFGVWGGLTELERQRLRRRGWAAA